MSHFFCFFPLTCSCLCELQEESRWVQAEPRHAVSRPEDKMQIDLNCEDSSGIRHDMSRKVNIKSFGFNNTMTFFFPLKSTQLVAVLH